MVFSYDAHHGFFLFWVGYPGFLVTFPAFATAGVVTATSTTPHAQGLVIRLNSFHVLIFFRVAMEGGRYFVNFLLIFEQTA